jgi:hypothetical protein
VLSRLASRQTPVVSVVLSPPLAADLIAESDRLVGLGTLVISSDDVLTMPVARRIEHRGPGLVGEQLGQGLQRLQLPRVQRA